MSDSTKRVVARKTHPCCGSGYECRGTIEPGHVYLRHVSFPGDVNSSGKPWVIRECLDCAITFGREVLAEPIPEGQPYRYWLGDARPRPDDVVEAS